MKNQITVILADDHPIFRKGLREVLAEDSMLNSLGEAADGVTALRQIREFKPTVAILDMDMPELNGIQIARKLLEEKLSTRIVILTMHKEERLFNEAINCGILGYVLKENAANDLIAAVRAASAGQPFISPSLSAFLLSRNARRQDLVAQKPGLHLLTPAERRIVKMITQEFTSKEIAEELQISLHTVENHRANICEKLQLHGSHSLLKFAFDNKSDL